MSVSQIFVRIYLLGMVVLWGRVYFLFRQISKHTVLGVEPIYPVHSDSLGLPPDEFLSETGKSIQRQWGRAIIAAVIWSLSIVIVQLAAQNLYLFF